MISFINTKKPFQNWSLVTIFMFCMGFQLMASSHREAPLIANDPLADNTDLYAFRSPDNPDMITIVACYVPGQLPHGGPNYYSFGENIRYEIHIDNNTATPGDDIVYRFTFQKENEDPTTFFNIRLGAQNQKTTYMLERSMDGGVSFETIVSNGIVPPNNIGPRSIEDAVVGLGTTYGALVDGAITSASTGETVFAGPTDDPFYVDLGGIFDLGNSSRQGESSRDGLACYNVSSLVINVPISTLLKDGAAATPANILDGDYVIGVWASASRPQIRTLNTGGTAGATYDGPWVQVSRLGMPLTNEAVIPIGAKDEWNARTPYNENPDHFEYFYNPELGLYMDDDLFGGAVPAFSPLRIQRASLGAFDFGNGQDGLYGLKGNPALAGTALDDAVFGTLLLPAPGKPRSVDLWPAFHTGVPNFPPYQLATGKEGNPLAAGKPFVNNFLPNGGDMLRLNMAVPPTDRSDANFSSLGLIQAAVLGLLDPAYNTNTDIQFIPNMDGFPNGRRLEDDVTRIELQAVSGAVLAAIGLWYDDYNAETSASPVTDNLLSVLGYSTGVEENDRPFSSSFPYLAQARSGTGECSGLIISDGDTGTGNAGEADLELSITTTSASYDIYTQVPYTITLTNNGGETATNVTVSAGLPDGLVFTSAEPSVGDYHLFFGRWSVPSLAAGESATLKLTLFTLVQGQDVSNYAEVLSSDQPDPDSTPGNGNGVSSNEDDEASTTISTNVASNDATGRMIDVEGNTLAIEKLYPVPATDRLNASLESATSGDVHIAIYDAKGNLVMTKKDTFVEGMNTVELNTTSLSSGAYFIGFMNAGKVSSKQQFVIIK